MAVNKVIPIASGGRLVLTMDDVNLFDVSEHERKLLDDLAAAVRTYERQLAKESDTKPDPKPDLR